MHLLLPFLVPAPFSTVRNNFGLPLFQALFPAFPPAKLIRYDGNTPGSIVDVELNFLLFKQHWISRITSETETSTSYVFVDEGIALPFFMRAWQHIHRIEATSTGTRITEDIVFEAAPFVPGFLLRAVLKAQFGARGPLYTRYYTGLARGGDAGPR